MLLMRMLTSGTNSRLHKRLRSDKELVYAVTGVHSRMHDVGSIGCLIFVDPDIVEVLKATEITLEELRNFSAGRFNNDELTIAKRKAVTSFTVAMEGQTAVLDYHVDRAIKGLLPESPQAYIDRIEKVTVEQIVTVAKRIFVNERLNLLYFGRRSEEVAKALEGGVFF